jgi:hypothetical protein
MLRLSWKEWAVLWIVLANCCTATLLVGLEMAWRAALESQAIVY